MARDFNDSNQVRYQGRDNDEDRNGRNSEIGAAARGSKACKIVVRDGNPSKMTTDRYGSQGRVNDFRAD